MEIHPLIYHKLIDPLLEGTRRRIQEQVRPGDSVLDIACGTGELVRSLNGKCQTVAGIDLDERMIRFARRLSDREGKPDCDFHCTDATEADFYINKSFSIINMSLAIHQFSPAETEKIIEHLALHTDTLLITDYSFPLPGGIKGMLLHLIERMAGKAHYSNFRKFLQRGGIPGIFRNKAFSPEFSSVSGSGVFTIYRLKRV